MLWFCWSARLCKAPGGRGDTAGRFGVILGIRRISPTAEVKSWTQCWPSPERGLALKSGAGQRHREDILKFLFPSLTCSASLLRRPRSPRTRKQLVSVIRCCTYFHHFIPPVVFVCFSVVTKSLVSSCHAAVNHRSIACRCKELEREKGGERDWEGPNVYHCGELDSRCWDNEKNKQTIMQK